MNCYIRVDSSYQIGSGHLMRCLTLAEELRTKGANIVFICRELNGNLIDLVESKNFLVYKLSNSNETGRIRKQTQHWSWLEVDWQKDGFDTKNILSKTKGTVDWLIVDHYSLDIHWERMMRPLVKKIMVIDDLADREHDCDILLDQNYYDDLEMRYLNLVPHNCKKFLGPQFALLRPEFKIAKKELNTRSGKIENIFVFFGGSDQSNETLKVLRAFEMVNNDNLNVNVVVGKSNPNKEVIEKICLDNPVFKFHCQTNNMAKLMVKSDLAIGAGGSTTWERCYLGLPTIVLIVAQNQSETTQALAEKGIIINLGYAKNVSESDIALKIKDALINPKKIKEMSDNCLGLMEEHDQKIEELINTLLEVTYG